MNNKEFAKWTFLVVDDVPDNLMIAQRLLEYSGATVHTAIDGIHALKMLETIEPDLILLDILMPHLDGFETLAKIREIPRFKETPVIAITASTLDYSPRDVLKAGFDGYVPKPFALNVFREQVSATLAKHLAKTTS